MQIILLSLIINEGKLTLKNVMFSICTKKHDKFVNIHDDKMVNDVNFFFKSMDKKYCILGQQ